MNLFGAAAIIGRLGPAAGPAVTPSPNGGAGTVDGETARRAARLELRRPEYHRDDPSVLQRAWNWVFQRFTSLLDHAFHGQVADVLILAIAVGAVIAVALLLRRAGRPARTTTFLGSDLGTAASAAEHRAAAERYSAAGDWALALREWLRACSAATEERGLLAPKPGRTAAELARSAGARLPAAASALLRAGNAFDEIWFADRAATPDDAELGRRADAAVRTASQNTEETSLPAYAVPR